MKNKYRKERGSITLFVLVSMLFFVMFLITMHTLVINNEVAQRDATSNIEGTYSEGTEDMDKVYGFCEEFLPYLEAAAEENPITEIGAVAELSLRRYTEQLERILGDSTKEKEEKKENPERKIFQGSCVSVTACADHNLELSYMYGNVLVKPLPEEKVSPEKPISNLSIEEEYSPFAI